MCLFFKPREHFADFQNFQRLLQGQQKGQTAEIIFQLAASFSLELLNDLNLQLSSTSFQQPKLFWKLINNPSPGSKVTHLSVYKLDLIHTLLWLKSGAN